MLNTFLKSSSKNSLSLAVSFRISAFSCQKNKNKCVHWSKHKEVSSGWWWQFLTLLYVAQLVKMSWTSVTNSPTVLCDCTWSLSAKLPSHTGVPIAAAEPGGWHFDHATRRETRWGLVTAQDEQNHNRVFRKLRRELGFPRRQSPLHMWPQQEKTPMVSKINTDSPTGHFIRYAAGAEKDS